jgi:hypothetical protein
MNKTEGFFKAYLAYSGNNTVFTKNTPEEMMLSGLDNDGWFSWKLIPGTLQVSDYKALEHQFSVELPHSFIDWHRQYFFLDCDCSLVRLPESNPNSPLKEVIDNLRWESHKKLSSQKLYPFASEGNDTGPLVFDGRKEMADNEFPIRVYDHDFDGSLTGLSEIIFSSFSKLLDCLTHYMTELKTKRNFEIIPDFFIIDPTGAGTTGLGYWNTWKDMLKGNYEEFGE